MDEKIKTLNPINVKDIAPFEALPGIFRKTLAYNQDTMLCFFQLEKDSDIPLHNHPNVQIGYIISGKIQFLSDQKDFEFIAIQGDSYVFEAEEMHGANVLEDTELIEVFYPYRPEYEPRE
jgi:quercetin dioxygenase-like cupin family protein